MRVVFVHVVDAGDYKVSITCASHRLGPLARVITNNHIFTNEFYVFLLYIIAKLSILMYIIANIKWSCSVSFHFTDHGRT